MADSDDELYYLQPGFNLSSLTIPKLRGILVQHDVGWSSSAKKAELIQLVEDEILPKAKKLLRERDRVRRTSRGITDLSSQESTAGADDNARDLMPPPPAPKTPRSRKSKSNLADATPSTSRRSKTPTTRKTGSRARASDTETEGESVRPSARKTRKSTPGPTPVLAPAVKLEEPRRVKREAGESPFSDDNPFQQGSSPTSDSRRVSSSRRKSGGRPSSSRRRDTTSPLIKREDDGHTSYQFPVEQLRSADYIPATEEFTPEAAQEVAAEDRLAPRRTQALVRRKKKQSSPAAKNVSLGALTVVLAALAGWYRQEKVNIGYCGVGAPEWSLAANPNIPPWVHETMQPNCEPCPQHAVCFPNMEVQCEQDFVLSQHPLALGGLVPVPPTCEPDSEKERRIKAVADKAIEELRERRAAYECGEEITDVEAPFTEGEEEVKTIVKAGETKLEISEQALKARVSAQRRRDMSPAEFEALFEGALEDIKGREEVEVVRDGTRTFLRSTSLAKLPLTCAVRRYAIRTLAANRIPIALLIFFLTGLIYARSRVVAYRAATAQIPSLVATTLDRLATQAALKEDGRAKEAHLSVGGLRDDVLRNVFSARERERVWANVRKIVEGNSNVRAATREGRGGEVGRVWEWIGPVDFAGVAGLEGRRSGSAYSLGGGARRSLGMPVDEQNADVAGEVGQASGVESRNWNEGRHYF